MEYQDDYDNVKAESAKPKLLSKVSRRIDSMLRTNGIDSQKMGIKDEIEDLSTQIIIDVLREQRTSISNTLKLLKNF